MGAPTPASLPNGPGAGALRHLGSNPTSPVGGLVRVFLGTAGAASNAPRPPKVHPECWPRSHFGFSGRFNPSLALWGCIARRRPAGSVGVLAGCSRVRRALPPMRHVYLRFTRSAGPDPISGFSGRFNPLSSPGLPGQAGQASGCDAGGGWCSGERRALPPMRHVSLRFTRSAGPDPISGFSGRFNPLSSPGHPGQAGQASVCGPGGGGRSWERRVLPPMRHVSLRFTRSAGPDPIFWVFGPL